MCFQCIFASAKNTDSTTTTPKPSLPPNNSTESTISTIRLNDCSVKCASVTNDVMHGFVLSASACQISCVTEKPANENSNKPMFVHNDYNLGNVNQTYNQHPFKRELKKD